MSKDIYVMVVANDDGRDPDGPLVFEQYTRKASKKDIENRIARMGDRYGKCRIAKLVFEDEGT